MYNHTTQAIAVARETGYDLDAEALTREWSGIGIGPVGQSRDSDTLERSNYTAVLKALTEDYPDSVADVRFGHWAVGWVEEIIYDTGNAAAVARVGEWRESLDDYPVADEEAFSALEYAEALELIPDLLPEFIEDHTLELRDPLPEDYASEIFDTMCDAGCDISPDGMRESDVIDAALNLGYYHTTEES